MLNTDNIIWVNSTNLKVDGAAITKGECRSAEGKEFDFTPELMTKILSHFNDAVPLKIGHGETPEVGRAFKLGYDKVSSNLPFEGHVYGDDKRRSIESCGYNKISPEIDFTFDETGKPIDGVITALAFVKVPAMEGTQVNCQQMTFSAPTDEGNTHMKQEGIMVFYPKGTDIKDIPTETQSPPSANFEADVVKYKEMSAKFEAEVVDLKAKVDEVSTSNVDLNAQLNDYKSKVETLTAENTGFIQEKTDAVVAELKTMGIKAPETIGADLPAKQRIEVLRQIKSNFVIQSKADNPTDPVHVPKGELTAREKAMESIPEELRKFINSGV